MRFTNKICVSALALIGVLAVCSLVPSDAVAQPLEFFRVAPLKPPVHDDGPAWISAVNDRVAVSGTLVFLADGDAGLRVFSLADARNPQLVAEHRDAGWANTVRVKGNRLYVTGSSGFAAYEILKSMRLRRLRASEVTLDEWFESRGTKTSEDNDLPCIAAIVDGRVYISREDIGVAMVPMQGPSAGDRGKSPVEPLSPSPASAEWVPGWTAMQAPLSAITQARSSAFGEVPAEIPDPSLTVGNESENDPAPRLMAGIEEDVIRIRVSGQPGQIIRVQRTTSITGGWRDWQQITFDGTELELTDSATSGHVFYRAILELPR